MRGVRHSVTSAHALERREFLGLGTAAVLGLSAAPALAVAAADAQAIARTRAGRVRGEALEGIFRFRGIRYGADTTGRRFLPPRAPKPWRDVQDALEYGNEAPQVPIGEGGGIFRGLHTPRPMSEDCLFLNVWTPGLRDGKKRPVMVWFHGGGWFNGSGASVLYEGTRLAKRGDVVVVTVNHRLNVFGYLYLGDKASDLADTGNIGTLDTLLSLEWVRDNIAEFGGDPHNVTIFGQSGGGGKCSVLLAMPKAKGLIHKAIIQSGAMLSLLSMERAKGVTAGMMEAVGLTPSQVDALRTMPIEKVIEGLKKNPRGTFRLSPLVDGRTVTRNPFDPDAPDTARDIPMMIGCTRYEAGMNRPAIEESALTARLAPILKEKDAGAIVAELRRLYPYSSPTDLLVTAMSWLTFRHNSAVYTERKVAQGGAPVFSYLSAWETPVDDGKWRAPHSYDLGLIFDNVAKAPGLVGTNGQAQLVADAMSTAWVNFARTGNPGWEPYDLNRRKTMVFNETSKVTSDPDGEERELFDGPPVNMLESNLIG